MVQNAAQSIRDKTARLNSLKEKVEQFIKDGGDLKSPEAVPLGVEFVQAFFELAKEVGGDTPKEETGDGASGTRTVVTFPSGY
jgi:hypothetical protein